MSSDDPLRAIVLAVGATVLFGSSDTIAKFLSTSLPIAEFLWIRSHLQALAALGPTPLHRHTFEPLKSSR